MANSFNTHFVNIGPELTTEIPKSNKSYKDPLCPTTTKISIFPISKYQLNKFIGRIAPKKSQDVNEISMYIINYMKTSISKPLSHIQRGHHQNILNTEQKSSNTEILNPKIRL